MAKQIPIQFITEPACLPYRKAAEYIAVSRWTLRKLVALGKIRELPAKTFAVAELDRYAREEAA